MPTYSSISLTKLDADGIQVTEEETEDPSTRDTQPEDDSADSANVSLVDPHFSKSFQPPSPDWSRATKLKLILVLLFTPILALFIGAAIVDSLFADELEGQGLYTRPECHIAGVRGSATAYTHTLVAFNAHDNLCLHAPPLPRDIDAYAYATKHALVSLPAKCVRALNLTANFADKGRHVELWYGRRRSVPHWSSSRTQTTLSTCACGWVILSSGSGGVTWKNIQYMRMLPALGYGVIAPDTMAMPESYKLKRKTPLAPLLPCANLADYWTGVTVYNGTCRWPHVPSNITTRPNPAPSSSSSPTPLPQQSHASSDGIPAPWEHYPYCYSSQEENMLADPAGWALYYERIFQVRARELDYLVEHLPRFLALAPRLPLFLLGQSEGGMVVARYHHPRLDRRLAGRVVSSWSCEANYYTRCPRVCGGQCDRRVPVLNVIGALDQYFGPSPAHSLSSNVSARAPAHPPAGAVWVGSDEIASSDRCVAAETVYSQDDEPLPGPPAVKGHCFDALVQGNFESATVVVVEEAQHDIALVADNFLRVALASFLSDPAGFQGRVHTDWPARRAWHRELCHCRDEEGTPCVTAVGGALMVRCRDQSNNMENYFPESLTGGLSSVACVGAENVSGVESACG